MQDISSDSKRVAKNTLLLYVRMLFTIIVGLYTSRVVINTLGISDYGIYNVVGGIVAMLAFLNTAMVVSSQRFLSFELGKKNLDRLGKVFNTSLISHLILSVIILALAETIGLWFLNTHLNIVEERLFAANWVYQCSVLTFMLTVLSVPYNSCIVAHEHMKIFAYISIVEVLLKLLAVFLLQVLYTDKLITYALLILGVSVIIRLTYGIYCQRHFAECSHSSSFSFDKKLFKEMFAFTGWSLLGNGGDAFRDQGSNIILNLFCGTGINAARGIALQVNGIIANFSNNFLMALNPQITKQYAGRNMAQFTQLVYSGSRFGFYLLLIISVPVMINIKFLLNLWLGNVPQYADLFLLFALQIALVDVMTKPLITAMQATGQIRNVQIAICIIMLSELPLAYWVLHMGYEPYVIMIPALVMAFVRLFTRFFLLKKIIPEYDYKHFFLNIVLKNVVLFVFCYLISLYMHSMFEENFVNMLFTSLLSVLITGYSVFRIGLRSEERTWVCNKIHILKYL